jgi:hypothetical protein
VAGIALLGYYIDHVRHFISADLTQPQMPTGIPTPRTFVYKTDENEYEIACDVYVPANFSKPCPMIIWMHYIGLVFENRHAVGHACFILHLSEDML